MAAATLSPRRSATTDPIASVEQWFKFNGVPHFVGHYSLKDRRKLLLFLLLTLAAFQLGAAPRLNLNPWELLLALAVLMWLALCAKPALAHLLEPDCPPTPASSIVLRVVAVGGTLALVVRTVPPGEYGDAWTHFAVLLVTAIATAALSSRRSWERILGHRPRSATALTVALGVLVILFALEGSLFRTWYDVLLADSSDLHRLPQALPGLLVMLVLLGFVIWLLGADRPGGPAPSARTLDLEFPAVPLLLLVLGLEIAVLPEAAPGEWLALAVPAVLLAFALVSVVVMNRSGRSSGSAQLLRYLAVIFVFAYPAIVGLYFEIDFFGEVMAGPAAFGLAAAINLLSLAVASLLVRLGIDRVAGWAAREVHAERTRVLEGLAGGLPLLLILTVFLVMQAELWQVAFLTSDAGYLALLGLMLALGASVTLLTARKTLDRQRPFRSWRDVRRAAVRSGRVTIAQAPKERFREELRRLESAKRSSRPPAPRLTGPSRYNAIAVIAVYQAIVFVPIVLAAAALFWCLARLAVPPPVAAEWIFGDVSGSARDAELLAPGFLEQPWTRVALLLAAFSYLYLAVQIPASPEQRKDFLAGVDRGIRQRLAMRLAYLELLREEERPAQADSPACLAGEISAP